MVSSPPPVLPDRLATGADRLAVRYRGQFSAETIQGLIVDSYAHITELLDLLAQPLNPRNPHQRSTTS